jgi:hypothetical protein
MQAAAAERPSRSRAEAGQGWGDMWPHAVCPALKKTTSMTRRKSTSRLHRAGTMPSMHVDPRAPPVCHMHGMAKTGWLTRFGAHTGHCCSATTDPFGATPLMAPHQELLSELWMQCSFGSFHAGRAVTGCSTNKSNCPGHREFNRAQAMHGPFELERLLSGREEGFLFSLFALPFLSHTTHLEAANLITHDPAREGCSNRDLLPGQGLRPRLFSDPPCMHTHSFF